MWWLSGLPWDIEGANRCRSYLRYQKSIKLKISKFGLTSLIQIWAVACPFLDKGSKSIFNILSKWRKRETCFFFTKKGLCFPEFSAFSKKIGFLAARLVARNFTRALGYAKRPLSPLPDIACCRHRVLPLARTPDIAYARHRVHPTSRTPDIVYAWHRVRPTSRVADIAAAKP